MSRLGDGSADTNRLGISLHGSFGSRDAYFAIRPRYTHRLNKTMTTSVSVGWIFATTEANNPLEDATLSENGFLGGVRISHGDIAFGTDMRLLEVGPSFQHKGGTETTVLAGVSFLGSPGVKLAAFGGGIIVVLSALYLTSL